MIKKMSSLLCILSALIGASSPPFLDTKTSWAEETLQKLSLRQKIGQLFMVAAASNFSQPAESLALAMCTCPYNMNQDHIENLIEQYGVGGIIFLCKSTPHKQITLQSMLQRKSQVPLLFAQDFEWGLSMRLDLDPSQVVRYPRNMTLAALSDKQLIYQLGNEIGLQCKALGVHMNFAPVCDVNNPENPVIHDRSFGDNPEGVAQLACLFAQGLQDAGILACAKHFPGHGDTNVDSHLDLPIINYDRARLEAIELSPFRKMINAGVAAVMTAHLFIPALDSTENQPASLSHKIITNELKNTLNFKGLVITDGLGMQAITKYYQPGDIELRAFLAGNDILLCPLDVPRAIDLIEQSIKGGIVSEEELNRRVLKFLKAKEWILAQKQKEDVAFLTRSEAYELQKKLYRNAITYVQQNDTIIFSKKLINESCIIQIGELSGKKADYYYPSNLSQNDVQDCLEKAQFHDTAILMVGSMNKFAQMQFGISAETRILVTQLKNLGKKVVIVLFGTPYSIKYFAQADAVIVAYVDIPLMYQAACDVLQGDLVAEGRLPVIVK